MEVYTGALRVELLNCRAFFGDSTQNIFWLPVYTLLIEVYTGVLRVERWGIRCDYTHYISNRWGLGGVPLLPYRHGLKRGRVRGVQDGGVNS